MNKIFNLTSTFKAAESDDGSVMIRGMASTADFDRAGDTISAEAWTKGGLQNFEKNPIILFNHDYDRPIGRATAMKAGPNGLELECKISKNAPGNVAELVKDGVLGAFSVGFKVKDADYLKETDGLMIKDAELFEVSVVSVPCNQAATFSLAKSFDSQDEYNEFKKTFTNRVDLAGQSLAKDEDISSNIASDHTPKSAETNSADQEIKMDNQNIDLEAFAKKVAEDTAAKIAMKQAEQKAADEAVAKAAQEAEAAKAVEAQSIKSSIQSGIETGVEALQADLEKEFSAKDADHQAIVEKYKADLEEKAVELEAMRKSKRDFSGRSGAEATGSEILGAHILGKITGKGFDTDYGKSIVEKAGATVTATGNVTISLDTTVATQFEEEVKLEQKVAGLFREIAVTGGATVLPVNPDAEAATFATAAAAGNLENNTNGTAASNSAYAVGQVILKPHRLISSTNLLNDTDEKTLVSLLPMLQNAMARAHARAKDKMCLFGNGSPAIAGLVGGDGSDGGTGLVSQDVSAAGGNAVADFDISDNDLLTSVNIIKARSQMGKYGLNSSDLAVIVSPLGYMELMQDAAFADVSQVGELSMKASGIVGAIYGMPVVVSDLLTKADDTTSFAIVNTRNYVIPRLRGVSIESDYSVTNQRTDLVASQSIGFAELVAGYALNYPAVHAIHQA
jgi:HK97 family phage prohead protease/HK97 family phage major capsid protein